MRSGFSDAFGEAVLLPFSAFIPNRPEPNLRHFMPPYLLLAALFVPALLAIAIDHRLRRRP